MGTSAEDQVHESPRKEPRATDASYTRKAQPEVEKAPEDPEFMKRFRKCWCNATDDNYLTLFGFRRFRTAHLLNLRFLEEEIHKIDHEIYQAGMNLGCPLGAIDRLGLKHGKRDLVAAGDAGTGSVVNQDLITSLRALLRQYGTCDPSQGSFLD